MKKLPIYLLFSIMALAIATPALAQTPQEDQYGGPELTCDNYLEFEVPPPELIEKCEDGQYGAKHVIPEASKSSSQTFENFASVLSRLKSDGANESEAAAAELDESSPSSRSAEDKSGGSREKSGEEDSLENKTEASKSLGSITELPDTGGPAPFLLGAGALLFAGGLTVGRFFR